MGKMKRSKRGPSLLSRTALGAVLYIRVSSAEQAKQQYNLPTQEKKLRDYCGREKLPVFRVFSDAGESARTDDRPNFEKMLAYCQENRSKVSHVVVADLSRLARNVLDQGITIATLSQLEITLVSIDEPITGDTAAGKLARNMLGSIHQFFSDSLSERTRFRMAEAVKAGRFVWVAPIGYVNTNNGTGKTIKPDKERASLVLKSFELMATGAYSSDDVLRTVTALGLTTRKGAPVPRQTWYAMLRNPLYAGWVKSGTLIAQGIHEPIVPQELFDEVQTVLSGKSRSTLPRQVVRPDFPLKQFIRCAKCDGGLTAGIAKKKFPYYWCYRKGCRSVFVPKEELENHFIRLLASHEPTIEYLNLLPEIAAKTWEIREERIKQDSRALSIRLAEQTRLNSQAIKAKVTGELASEDFDALKANIAEEKQKIESALSALESERKTLQQMSKQAKLEKISFVATWRNAGIQGKLELQKALFPDGLVWSHETGFLNRKNKSLMQGLNDFFDEYLQSLPNANESMSERIDRFIVKFGVPDGI
jgi:site-specific DNA recombinase